MSENNTIAILIAIAGAVVLLAFLLLKPFELVSSGSRGVVTSFGKVSDEVLPEGFNWIGLTESVTEMSVQTQRFEAKAAAASKDLQSVTAQVVVNARLDATAVNKLYQKIGMNYESTVIQPAIQESIKAATANYTAEELITKRSEVGEVMKNSLTEKLAKNFIIVESISIVDFDFSESFNKAVEAKVTAEQEALAAKNNLEKVKFEAEQRIAEAQGEAEAIRIQAQAIQNQGGAEYVQLKWVEKWNGALPTTTLGDGANVLYGM